MTKIQILENEKFIEYADFDNAEIWLLNRYSDEELDERIIVIPEIAESLAPNCEKFPLLLSEIYKKYPEKTNYDEKGNFAGVEMDFDYILITDNKESFAVHAYVCDVAKIDVVEKITD